MAEPKERGGATYRRIPSDVNEVKYIRDLINADADARAGALAEAKKFDELHQLLEIRVSWNDRYADLTAELDEDEPRFASGAPQNPKPPKPEPKSKPVTGGATPVAAAKPTT